MRCIAEPDLVQEIGLSLGQFDVGYSQTRTPLQDEKATSSTYSLLLLTASVAKTNFLR